MLAYGASMKRILLTKGKYAIVDDVDYKWLMQWKWQAHNYHGKWYATRGALKGEGCGTILMHRQIMYASRGEEVDHINHNTLDNRRSMLRRCSKSQNLSNHRKCYRGNLSGFLGVTKHGPGWKARVRKGGRMHHFGTYTDPIIAALARDIGAVLLHGRYASLNLCENPLLFESCDARTFIETKDGNGVGRTNS